MVDRELVFISDVTEFHNPARPLGGSAPETPFQPKCIFTGDRKCHTPKTCKLLKNGWPIPVHGVETEEVDDILEGTHDCAYEIVPELRDRAFQIEESPDGKLIWARKIGAVASVISTKRDEELRARSKQAPEQPEAN